MSSCFDSCLARKAKAKSNGHNQKPSEFENKVQEVVQMVKESVLLGGHRESPLLDNANAQRELNALIQGLLLSFTQALDTLAFSNDGMQNESSAVSQLIGSPAIYRGNEGSGPGWEQRLLTTLSNSQYTAKVVLPRLSEVFSRHDYPPLTLPVATATSALSALDRQILEVYLEQKSDPLVGTIEPSMYLGRFDWDTTRRPTDVQPYIKEIITNMIGVHAEVHHVNPNLVSRVLSQIVETVAEELSRLMSCVTRFSIQGNQQARVDIRAVQETVSLYTTPTAQLVEDLLAKFRVRMRLQLMCFGDMKIVSSGSCVVCFTLPPDEFDRMKPRSEDRVMMIGSLQETANTYFSSGSRVKCELCSLHAALKWVYFCRECRVPFNTKNEHKCAKSATLKRFVAEADLWSVKTVGVGSQTRHALITKNVPVFAEVTGRSVMLKRFARQETLLQGAAGTYLHEPNLCVVQTCCKACVHIDGNDHHCTDCGGDRTRIFKAGAAMLVYRRSHLKENTIGIIPNGGYRCADQQSHIAVQWLCWEAHQRGVSILHAGNGREEYVLGRRVDGVVKAGDTTTVFQFWGCYWHGCTLCYPDRTTPVKNSPHETMETRYEATMACVEKFKNAGYTVVEMELGGGRGVCEVVPEAAIVSLSILGSLTTDE
uniref:Exocyst complex component 2 n=1 Tax=Timema shepardi TaxID=629360 RepID=A0A7R9B323_TIMSH|nr:unnamed protein product [Timema shepardi]